MRRFFDHIDLRVRHLVEAKSFYDVLLPALGFAHEAKIEGWYSTKRPEPMARQSFLA